MKAIAFAAGIILAASPVSAASEHQHGHTHHHDPTGGPNNSQPYAGLEQRPIKALSPEEIAGLREGQGLGMALAAELNGYPGPRHVLDMAEELALTKHQHHQTKAAFDEMTAKAAALGAAVIAAEQDLDRLFSTGTANETAIADATASVAILRGKLRSTHLGYHLRMRQILTSEQVAKYNKLRGYTND